MISWFPNGDLVIRTAEGFLGPSFAAFLLVCAAAALLLLVVVAGGVIAAAIVGDRRAGARRRLQAASRPPFVPVRAVAARRVGPASAPPAAPADKPALTILFATDTSNAEGLAIAAGQAASRLGFEPRVVDMADTTPAEMAGAQRLIVIASTWGEGEPPPRAADFYDALMAPDAPRFAEMPFAVLALGDRAYARLGHFCETGRFLDVRLAQLGGTRVAERSECDADYEAQASAWIGATLRTLASPEQLRAAGSAGEQPAVIQTEIQGPAGTAAGWGTRAHPFDVKILEKLDLTHSGPGIHTYHMALSLAGSEALHEPGDSLGVLPRNDPLEVEAVLDAVGLGADATLSEAMATHYDITTLTMPQLVSYAALSGTEALAQLVADEGRAAEFLADRQLIDLLTAHPCLLSADQLTGLLRRLQPRLYSIASSRKVVPDQVHLLIAGLQYEAHGRLRSGVASMDLIERRAVGEQVRVYIKRNPHFRLPSDPERSIIMIGPGTGLAPFRAFMQERSAMGATGRSWLFFGHRHQAGDFFYEAEWQDLRKRGVLTRLDLAFSRDQPQKIYVQDRMWEARHDLFAWLEGGAALYVCGNASSMARGVNAMLVRIAADQGSLREPDAQAWLDRLRREGRYLRDVY